MDRSYRRLRGLVPVAIAHLAILLQAGATWAQTPNASFAASLVSSAPADSLATRLDYFGRLVGSWNIEVTYHPHDAPEEVYPGEWHFSWVLDGRAVQDVWRVNGVTTEGTPFLRGLGSTVRTFDPAIGAWRSVWVSALSNSITPFIGRDVGDELVLEPEHPDPEESFRWIFFAMAEDHFRWRAESSTDGGATWRLEQEMTAWRR